MPDKQADESNLYEWYKLVGIEKQTTQGDILREIPINQMIPIETEPFYANVGKIIPSGIVITQACDFQKTNVKDVMICPIVPFDHVLLAKLKHEFKGKVEQLTPEQLQRKKEIIDNFAQGRYLDYYILNKASFENEPEYNFHYQVVLLRQSFQMPKAVLEKIISQRKGKKVRMQLPYREHLGKAYARLFDRIGLPNDIEFQDGEI